MRTRPGRYFFARGGVLGCNMPAAVGAALADEGLGRLAGGGWRGDVFAAGFVERRASPREGDFRRVQQPPLRRVAERGRSLGYANAKAGHFVGMETVDPAIDFAALVQVVGTPLRWPATREAVLAAFAKAVKRDGPTLVEIPIG